ncbi:uncharacterized protein KY384_004659 [Bacidia gigantensis]|uniref:uncharacterized protein n=1 Tax=Bacidia gigantensis TaxID=2732470 RepID=UPI001D054340|nr:uncharacterized protein KY384_004659 [Bacidia gigantensis]KAG8530621.1 hypothetical protein KY384_004659 [Bacidia gigantensis]
MLGFKSIPGFNSGQLIGFSEFTLSIDPEAATRSSSETSFLQDTLDRPNLLVHQRSLAKSLVFNNTTTATSVLLDTFGKTYSLSARREVILAAGVFRTPQLLLASGIGSAATLEKLGVPLRTDLPGVGQNLHDQPFFSVSYRVNVTTNSELTTNQSAAAKAANDYLTRQSGRLSSGWEKLPESYRVNFTKSARTELAQFPSHWPEIEVVPSAAITIPVTDQAQYASIQVAISSTTSVGTVTINTTDLSKNPIKDPKWLSTETDQQVAVQTLKRAREIGQATGVVMGDEYAPGPAVKTDADILAYIKKTMTTFHHAVGTCKMGKAEDSSAVVNTKGLVKGVEKLRIVDASIFPFLPPGHTQGVGVLKIMVDALAEKLAVEILKSKVSAESI